MPAQKLSGPPGISRGGFAGGVPVQPGVQPQGNELLDLADSLGNFSNSFEHSARVWHNSEQRRKVAKSERQTIRAEEQRQLGGKEAEALIANQLRGYTAAQIGEALQSEPLAKKFAENPYIMPAVQIHRGRVAADEAFQSMLSAGVNVRSPEAASKWLKENVGDLSDPFLSQGFNEQWSRHDAQLKSQQSKAALEKADTDRAQMGATEWDAKFTDVTQAGGTVQEAAEAALSAIYQGEGVQGWEASEIAVSKLREAAINGDLELAEAIAKAPRGDAPPLGKDARLADDVAMYVTQARTEYMQARDGLHIETRTALFDMIDAGVTRPALEASDGMQLLKAEDPEKYSQVIERWRSESERKRAEAKRNAAIAGKNSKRLDLAALAAQAIFAGEGEFLSDITLDLGEGVSLDMSRTDLRTSGMELLRNKLFPNGFLNLPEKGTQEGRIADESLRTYARRLKDSDMVDPQLASFLQGTLASMSPEGIQDADAKKDLAAAYRIYTAMDPAVARSYFTDAKQVAVFETMDKIVDGNPDVDLGQAAARAVARSFAARTLEAPPKEIRTAIEGMRILDPLNPNQGFFGIGAGENRVQVPVDKLQESVTDRVRDLMAYGLPKEAAIARATKEEQESYTIVYGKPVRLPNDGGINRATQESWARIVTKAVDHLATERKADPKEYTVSHVAGDVYLMTGPPTEDEPNGELTWVSANDLSVAAGERAKQEKQDVETERRKAAEAAVARRNAPPPSQPLPTTIR